MGRPRCYPLDAAAGTAEGGMNMSNFITRETAKCAVEAALELYPSEYDAVCEESDRAPGAYDVAPVRHGRGIK